MLHIANHTCFDERGLRRLLSRSAPGHVLLLIEDAVYAAKAGSVPAQQLAQWPQGLKVCVLEPDLAARGIARSEVIADITLVDYEGFVDLAVNSPVIHSWF